MGSWMENTQCGVHGPNYHTCHDIKGEVVPGAIGAGGAATDAPTSQAQPRRQGPRRLRMHQDSRQVLFCLPDTGLG